MGAGGPRPREELLGLPLAAHGRYWPETYCEVLLRAAESPQAGEDGDHEYGREESEESVTRDQDDGDVYGHAYENEGAGPA